MSMGYVRLENVETEFCLKDVNLSIKKGEFVVIMGHSGAGKSTILNVLAGFIEHHGKLYIDGKLFNGVPTQRGRWVTCIKTFIFSPI
jgi:ABC-type sugar transport system ATPase subunit